MPYNFALEEKKQKERLPVKRPQESRIKRKLREKIKSCGKTPNKIIAFSDIHSNLEALNAVLHEIEKRDDVLQILCAGDIVGYCANPIECCQKIMMLRIPVVQGNHDLNINGENLGWFNDVARQALKWTMSVLDQKCKNWLLTLPKFYEQEISGKKIYMVHGSPEDPTYQYVMPDTDISTLRHYLNLTKADILILGHTHIPFVKKISGKLIVNVGSVGQPRDGDSRASFAIIDLEKMKAEIVRIEYNIQGAAEKIYKSELPDFLAERLFQGI